jgi:hypothetical protein
MTETGCWEYVRRDVWREPAQQRWTEHDSRNHFTNHAWLMDLAEKPADQSGDDEDGPDL